MKRIIANSSMIRWAGFLGLTTLFVGAISILPAHADDYTRDNRNRNHIQRDIADIRRDQEHLHDLYHRREYLADRHDWKAVHRLDDEISRLKWHLDHDRQDIRQDVQRYHRDQDREYNQGRDGYSRNRNGSNTSYNGGYNNSGYNSGYRNNQPDYQDRNNDGRGDYRVH